MTSWEDLLSEQVRQLEAKANGFDPALSTKAMQLLRTIRGYETRVRHLALRVDYKLAGKL
jgi:hypothetical protein